MGHLRPSLVIRSKTGSLAAAKQLQHTAAENLAAGYSVSTNNYLRVTDLNVSRVGVPEGPRSSYFGRKLAS